MSKDLIREKQDLTYLSWSKIRHSSGTAGSFLKAEAELGGKKFYYKLSNFDNQAGIVGHECVNELIVDRILTVLGIEHLHYQLIHADVVIQEKIYETYVCVSEDFKGRGESKLALDAYYERNHMSGEDPLQFCLRNGWEEYIYRMLVVDYLICNRDRHGANMEILRNKQKKILRLAPLFDHGLSLLFHCTTEEETVKQDVLEDKMCNNFIGSRSVWKNLNLIPKGCLPKLQPLKETDKNVLMKDLDGVISETLQEKIWDMVWKRWCAYEDFCSQR